MRKYYIDYIIHSFFTIWTSYCNNGSYINSPSSNGSSIFISFSSFSAASTGNTIFFKYSSSSNYLATSLFGIPSFTNWSMLDTTISYLKGPKFISVPPPKPYCSSYLLVSELQKKGSTHTLKVWSSTFGISFCKRAQGEVSKQGFVFTSIRYTLQSVSIIKS